MLTFLGLLLRVVSITSASCRLMCYNALGVARMCGCRSFGLSAHALHGSLSACLSGLHLSLSIFPPVDCISLYVRVCLRCVSLLSPCLTPVVSPISCRCSLPQGRTHAQTQVAAALTQAARRFHPEFIMTTGDIIYKHGVRSAVDALFRERFEVPYSDAALQIPWHIIPGNHGTPTHSQPIVSWSNNCHY